MSKISHQNIEQWLFDYSEGNLNASQIRELNNFVQVHPEYQLDMDAWTNAKVSTTEAAPYVYADQLLAISNTGYAKRYLAAAGIFLLLGSSALFLYTSTTESENEIANNHPTVNGLTPSENQFLSFNEIASLSKNNYTPTNNSKTIASNETINPNTESNIHSSILNNSEEEKNNNIRYNTNSNSFNSTTSNSTKNNTANTNFVVNTNYNNGVNMLVNSNTTVNNNITPENSNDVQLVEEVILLDDLMPDKLFHQEPTIATNLTGEVMAKKAFENLAAGNKNNKTSGNEVVENTNKKKISEGRESANKKFFNEIELGLHNTRDHQLLYPGNQNTAEYASFAGSSVSPALNLNYRNNHLSSAVGTQSLNFIYDEFNRKISSAWGIGASRTVIGDGLHISNQAEFYFSPKIKINKTFTIEPALSASYHQNSMSSKVPVSGLDVEPYKGYVGKMSRPQSGGSNLNGFDMTASALVNTKYFYAVAGVDHILRPKQLFSSEDGTLNHRTEMRIKSTVGTDFKKLHESRVGISPQMTFIHQGQVNELWLGAAVSYDKLIFAGSVAQNGQFFTSVGINAGILKINYNFDFTRSYLNTKYFSSHEVSLRLALGGISKKSTTILDYKDK